MNHSLLCIFVINIVAVSVFSSYLSAVASKLFFSQLVIFTYFSSNRPLHPNKGNRIGRGTEHPAHDLESLSFFDLGALNWEVSFLNHDR